jgi:hypothetical protein
MAVMFDMYVPSSMLALHAAVCDRWLRRVGHQGRNAQKKKTVVRIIANSELVKSELLRFHCTSKLETHQPSETNIFPTIFNLVTLSINITL